MSSKKILIYGGKGALGSVCVNYFKSKNFVSKTFLIEKKK